jgi:putative aldouronate transport system permease protein
MADLEPFSPSLAAIPRQPRAGFLRGYARHRGLFLMFLLPLAWYALFQYAPMYGLLIAFKQFRFVDGILGSPGVGLAHFQEAFRSAEFWRVFRNTLVLSAYKLVFGFPAPIVLALLLNEVRARAFKKTVQTISYLPHFLSWVVLAGIFMAFLSPSTGPINALLRALGLKPVFFVADPRWFRPVIVVTAVWKTVGWNSVVYLAALAGVNPELYEAAHIDGAGRLKQTWHITVPSILPVIVIMFIFAIGAIVNDDFDQIFNLANPAVYRVGDVLSTYIYRVGLEGMRYSYSTALGLFKNLVAFALILVTNTVSRRLSDYGLW